MNNSATARWISWSALFLAFYSACAAEGETDITGYEPVGTGGAEVGGTGGASVDASAGQGGYSAKGGSGGTAIGGQAGTSPGGASGNGGTVGTSGYAGDSGVDASGGSGGTSAGGSAGSATGGSAGTAGKAGSAGASGKGGTAGSAGKGGSGGTAGKAGSAGAAGTGGTAGCPTIDSEPNNSEAQAQALGGITDCDSKASSVTGSLSSSSDQDWFSFHGDDVFGCSVNPTFTVTTSGSLDLCVYFLCDSGETEVTCQNGAQTSQSALGHSGCCSSTGALAAKVNCTNTTEDSTQVTVQAKTTSNTCFAYTIDYHY